MNETVELEFTIENLWKEFHRLVLSKIEPGSEEYDNMKTVWFCAIYDYNRSWACLNLDAEDSKRLYRELNEEVRSFIENDLKFRTSSVVGAFNG